MIEEFKALITKRIPNIPLLAITEDEWAQLAKQKSSKVALILEKLSVTRQSSYRTLLKMLTVKEPSSRSAKTPAIINETTYQPKRRRSRNNDQDDNPLICASSEIPSPFQTPIRNSGVRMTELEPATPEYNYSDVKKTPGGTKVHALFSTYHSDSKITLYKPFTPYKRPGQVGGMINIEHASSAAVEQKLPKSGVTRQQPISFEATLDRLNERKHTRRRVGQNTLMNSSCREFFEASGIKTTLKPHGSDYHWSHLIAYFLGGPQLRENIVPSSATANYKTLQLVEQFIANKLEQRCTSSILLCATPSYSGESLIPDEVQFCLTWVEAGKNFTENITINPRSDEWFTQSLHRSIDLLRDMVQTSEPQTFPPPSLS